jgi:hypothetical protein
MFYDWVCIWSCLFLCICLSLGHPSTCERKHASFVFLILANLTRCSPIASIYLQTPCHYSLWHGNIVYISHDFMIHSSVVGHLGCFQSLAIVSSAAICLTSSFPIWIPCISSSCLVVLARNSETVLKRGESNTPVSFLTLKKMVLVFPYLVWCWL